MENPATAYAPAIDDLSRPPMENPRSQIRPNNPCSKPTVPLKSTGTYLWHSHGLAHAGHG
eukprot:4349170-Lingulodinium_polyedra.AAC.1